MRLLYLDSHGMPCLAEFSGDKIPPYAILSHTWRLDGGEVTFKDISEGTARSKAGYTKISFCGEKAASHGLQYFWVDTCCIDKSNSVELQEAINSMFRWYKNAARCYVYLMDVSTIKRKISDQFSEFTWETAFRVSRWFTRGWTLQELLAPDSVEFFSREGKRLGDKGSLERQIHEITGIAISALRGTPLSQFGVDERFSWAENRQTTRKEDETYSLLGIFNVYMPLIYGEGRDNAFTRLREEIDKPSNALDRLSYAIDAPFNSYTKQNSPSCLPNTRVDLIREIYGWGDGQDERCIFWLNGLAGTGKSTIARTVARRYFDEKRLGASFFFARGGGDIGHGGKFVTSIAVQLASAVPTVRRLICDAITKDGVILSQSLRDQWQQLVLGPLSKLEATHYHASYVIVIDALDECDDENDIRIILQLLAEARSLKRFRLRIFLTSRPEMPIRHSFHRLPETEHYDFTLHSISPWIIEHDVSLFLEYNLRLIGEEDAQDASWPGPEVIKALAQRASGLFIWAATACRFIREGIFADERLRTLLMGETSAAATPEEHLNGLYATVLQNSIRPVFNQPDKERFCSMLREILGSVVVLFSPLSVKSLSRLLVTPKQRVDQMLKDLHAIIDIPDDHTRPLRLHHPSFRDFLLDKNRCGASSFWVDEKQAHRMLAASCVRLMSITLRRDICGLLHPGIFVADIENTRIQQCISPEIQYACTYWIQHVQISGVELSDDDYIHDFINQHFLHWLEAVSLIGKVSDSVRAISSLAAYLSAERSPRLHALVHDAKRFILSNTWIIEQIPLQLYCSALIFAPKMSIVRKQFEKQIPSWILRLPKTQPAWTTALQTLEGHAYTVYSVAFSPDGKQLASASEDTTVKLWDIASGTVLHTLEGHDEEVHAVAFSPPNGKLLASTSMDRTVRIWDAASGALLQLFDSDRVYIDAAFSLNGAQLASASETRMIRLWNTSPRASMETIEDHESYVNTVTFSPDGKRLASASWDATVRLWDAASGAHLQTLENHRVYINAIFSPDSKLLASTSEKTVRLWDSASGVLLRTFDDHSNFVNSLAFSPDSKRLASASDDKTARLWDTASGTLLQTLEGHSGHVNAVMFSSDGKRLISISKTTVRLWDVTLEAPLQTIELHSVYAKAVFSPDGKLLACTSDDNTVRLWDTVLGALLQTLEGHSAPTKVLAFSPDSNLLASASKRTIRLWNAASGALLRMLEGGDSLDDLTFSPEGEQLAATSTKTIRLWDAASGVLLQTLDGHSSYISTSVFSPDGSRLASASWDYTARLWDTASGELLLILKGHTSEVTDVVFSPDGKLLASASEDKRVKLWDATLGLPLQTLDGHKAHVNAIFSPDGKLLASTLEKTVRLWNTDLGTLLQELNGHGIFVNALAFSLDGKRLASAANDKVVRIWDTTSGVLLQILKGYVSAINLVAFSPNGKLLASASEDMTVRLWDLVSGKLLQQLEGHRLFDSAIFSPEGKLLTSVWDDEIIKLWDATSGVPLQICKLDSGPVRAVAFSPDGKRLASASEDTVRLWDTNSGELLRMLQGHRGFVHAVAFSPNGELLASAPSDQTVKLWDTTLRVYPQTTECHRSRVNDVSLSPDGKLLASASRDGTVRLWDVESEASLQTLQCYSGDVEAVTFSPDGKRLASISKKTVRLFDILSRRSLQAFKNHDWWNRTVVFSPDSKLLACASDNDTVNLCDAASGAPLQTLKGHSGFIEVLAFSPDSNLLASASKDETIRVWDAASGVTLKVLEGHKVYVNALVFSSDCKLLASAGWGATVKLWNTASGTLLQSLMVYNSPAKILAFSPDSQLVACAADDPMVRLWNVVSGECLQTLKVSFIIRTLSFSTEGPFLCTDQEDIRVKCYSPTPFQPRTDSTRKVIVREIGLLWVQITAFGFLLTTDPHVPLSETISSS